jgi:hypothetical protein
LNAGVAETPIPHLKTPRLALRTYA